MCSVTDEQISVEVAFALPEHQAIVPLQVPAGTTALEAAKRSNIVEQFPGLVLDEGSRLGIFGHVVAGTQALRHGDRVEIYRPLQADPKEVRKARAARAKARRSGESTGDAEGAAD
jgi:putative ubiquitin-RnfH superfamily antitoxin RatB of RatAB toxin-antitoxin module